MRIFLAGATGAIGRPLLRRLVEAGHEVSAMTRVAERGEALRAAGARAVVCDVFDPDGLRRAAQEARPEAVVHQLTAIPTRIDPRRVAQDIEPTNRLRTEGTRNLAAAAVAAGARRFLAQSVAFAYAPDGSALRSESDPLFLEAPPRFQAMVRAVAELEQTTLGTAELEGIVLRYGFFYGPGTVYARDGSFAEDVRRRRVPILGGGDGVFSFIHVEDAAAATVAALEGGAPGVYNVVDDEPAPVRNWLPYYAGLLGAKRPLRVPAWVGRVAAGPYAVYLMSQLPGASGEKVRRALGWSPRVPSWREGFARLLGG